MLRRLEVGLADAEIDDGLALALELGGASQHLEGRLGAQALQVRDELQHGVSPVLRLVLLQARGPACGYDLAATNSRSGRSRKALRGALEDANPPIARGTLLWPPFRAAIRQPMTGRDS